MLNVLGLKSSTEIDKPWWGKESYVVANDLFKCLLEEYTISRFLKKSNSINKSRASTERIAIELGPNGGIRGKILLEQTVDDRL
jgi:hypothetical protein